METKIVIRDCDNYGEVLGLLTVKGLTKDDVWNIFSDVKYEYEGCWTVDDLIEGVAKSGHEYSWETNIEDLMV